MSMLECHIVAGGDVAEKPRSDFCTVLLLDFTI